MKPETPSQWHLVQEYLEAQPQYLEAHPQSLEAERVRELAVPMGPGNPKENVFLSIFQGPLGPAIHAAARLRGRGLDGCLQRLWSHQISIRLLGYQTHKFPKSA